jgi:hypothetical protein
VGVVTDIPTATQRFSNGLNATPCPETSNVLLESGSHPIQLIPLSLEVIIVFKPSPTATHTLLGPAAIPCISAMIELGLGIQVAPLSSEYARLIAAVPTAIHLLVVGLYAIPYPFPEIVGPGTPVQLIPSFEVAIVKVPSPTATHFVPVGLHATP